MSLKMSHDSEAPAIGQQVITACAFIHARFDGVHKVFLPKRAHSKKFLPDIYELPGGHIDFGEDVIAGLKREIKEEFSMEITVGDPFAVFTYINDIKGSHAIEVIFFAQFINPLDEINLNPEDHSTYGWFAEDEIKTQVAINHKKEDDKELKALQKGFSLLNNTPPNFK